MTDTHAPSHDDLMFDVQYGHWYNLKCERLYRHVDLLLNITQLVGGSGAALAVVNESPGLLALVGVALAFAAAVSLLVQPGAKAERHARAKAGYTRLLASGPAMQAAQLAERLADVRVDAPTGPAALQNPAFNAALRAAGYKEGFATVTRFESVVDAIS